MGLIEPQEDVVLPDLTINRKYELGFEFPFDLTGFTPRMQIYKEDTVESEFLVEPVLVVESTSATLSIVSAKISESVSDAAFPKSGIREDYPFEFNMKDAAGDTQPYMFGVVPVRPGISEKPV